MESGPEQKAEEAVQLNESTCACGNYDCHSCFPLTESKDEEIADVLAENEIFDEVFDLAEGDDCDDEDEDLAEGDDDNTYTDADYPDVKEPDEDEDEFELVEGDLPPWLKDDEEDDSEEVDEGQYSNDPADDESDDYDGEECSAEPDDDFHTRYDDLDGEGDWDVKEDGNLNHERAKQRLNADVEEPEPIGNVNAAKAKARLQNTARRNAGHEEVEEAFPEFDDDDARFEPATNMCPDCEGSGEHYVERDHDGHSRSYKCERCDGVGEVHEGMEDPDDGGREFIDDLEDKMSDNDPCMYCDGSGCEVCDDPGNAFEDEFSRDNMEYAQANAEQEQPEWSPEMSELRALAGIGELAAKHINSGEESPFTNTITEEDPEDEFDDETSFDNPDAMVDIGDETMGSDMDAPVEPAEPMPSAASGAPDDVSDLINKIQYMQDMGISNSERHYDADNLWDANPEMVKRIYAKVAGELGEADMMDMGNRVDNDPDDLGGPISMDSPDEPERSWDHDDVEAQRFRKDRSIGADGAYSTQDGMEESGTVSSAGRKGSMDANAINDIATLDIDSAKAAAIDIITGSSTTDRKRMQLLRNVENARRPDQVVALLYNMLLAGEGMSSSGKWNSRYGESKDLSSVPGLNESADQDVVRAMKALFE